MKYRTKPILLTTAFLTVLVIQIPGVFAQGTYSCVLSADDGCVAAEGNNCAEGYFPSSCEGDTPGECTEPTRQCINAPPLAEKVNNLYNWALGAGALLALGIFIYAGVRYAASAGSSSAMGEAKKWMGAALGGLAILFGSYLFLKTINPDLLTLRDPTTPQNEPQEPPQISLTLPGGLLGSSDSVVRPLLTSCLNAGNSQDTCVEQCVEELVSSGLWSPVSSQDITTEVFCDRIADEIVGSGSLACKSSGERCLSPGVQSNCCGALTCTRESGTTYICRSGDEEDTSPSFTQGERDLLLRACSIASGFSGPVTNPDILKLVSGVENGKEKLECVAGGGYNASFLVNDWCTACEDNGGNLSGCFDAWNNDDSIVCAKE